MLLVCDGVSVFKGIFNKSLLKHALSRPTVRLVMWDCVCVAFVHVSLVNKATITPGQGGGGGWVFGVSRLKPSSCRV